jgi:hypothetical protein
MNKNNNADGDTKKFVFWTTDARGKLKINQYRLIKFLQKGGFYKTTTKNGKSVVRVKDNIVSEAPDFEMID